VYGSEEGRKGCADHKSAIGLSEMRDERKKKGGNVIRERGREGERERHM
jgi:hypothetical protein